MLETLSVEDFIPHVGLPVQLVAANTALAGVLREAKPQGGAGQGPRRGFSLLVSVEGPPTTPQGMYRLVLPDARSVEIFFVPVGRGEHGLELEAVFG
ncbi:MAG: hypothetical protein H6725_23845 [Sandaracinaceae bacterium]|nr:hypothetical protein [Myxococcales bacterium]MCB9630422.1 hypothetical protein [Sandaracinaceae bacterium]